MDITSVSFLIFVGVSLLIYWKLPTKYQWVLLLADSLIFYFVNIRAYTFLYLLAACLTVYLATGYFEKNREVEDKDKSKRLVLILSIVIVAGILAVLKYTNLCINTINSFRPSAKAAIPTVRWMASLGISFYTLTLLSYLLDCYWGVASCEKNPLKLLLYTSYFPLMISGPICNHDELVKGLFEEHRFDYSRVSGGVRRIGWGLAKKLVVADRLITVTDYMFGNPDIFTGIFVWIACAIYVIELYFDFSGCMDIVLGVSNVFGIELPENFEAPFLAQTMQEFWQRWHITLGRWLKNYIMNPVLKSQGFVNLSGFCKKKFGKKGKKYPSYLAMLILWFAMGLWHGDSWKYILGEGLWFWLIIVIGQIFAPGFTSLKKKLHIEDDNIVFVIFKTVRTFFFFCVGMLFFRAESLEASLYMLGKSFSHAPVIETIKSLYRGCFNEFGDFKAVAVVAVMIMLSFVCDLYTIRNRRISDKVVALPALFRWILYIILVALIVTMGVFGKSSFIYFGF